ENSTQAHAGQSQSVKQPLNRGIQPGFHVGMEKGARGLASVAEAGVPCYPFWLLCEGHTTFSDMSTDYLKRILTARVYDVAIESDLDLAPQVSARIGNTVLLKREDTQPVFSFKLRGAYNKMASLSSAERKRGVIAASAGNHAQGVALSASRMGCRAVIVMPETTPQVKIDAVRGFGGEVVLAEDSYNDAFDHAMELQKTEKLTFVHPFDDPDVIAGQGTIGMEILRQHSGPIEAVFVPVGGGGLIAGVASYIKQLRPEIKVIGVHSEDSCAM